MTKNAWQYWCSPVAVFIGVIFLDRLTKWWVLQHCTTSQKIFSWLSCTVVFNTGSMAHLFRPQSMLGFWFLIACIILVLVFIVMLMIRRIQRSQGINGYAAVVAGALSNVFDRFWYTGVIDFIDIHYGGWHYPTFNIADVAIVCGIIWIAFDEYQIKTVE